MIIRKSPLLFLVLLLLALSIPRTLRAQSSIMTVPSTGVVPAKQVYLEMDFITNEAWQRGDNKFQNYLPRAVVGLGHSVEAGVNISYTRVPGGDEPIDVQPNIKWQFHSNEKLGTAAAVGCILFVPVTDQAGTSMLGQCYLLGSKTLKGKLGPTFTGGVYALVNAKGDDRTKAGVIVGYEQPLSKKVSFIVDWSSGDNRLGYVSPGCYFATSSGSGLSIGYTIAQHSRGKNGMFAFYGIQFQ